MHQGHDKCRHGTSFAQSIVMKNLILMGLILFNTLSFAERNSEIFHQDPSIPSKLETKLDSDTRDKLKQINEILIDSRPQQVEIMLEEMKKSFSDLKLGGSSTGGGSDRTERFKALGHIYSSFLENLTQDDRQKYGISVTAQELKGIIIQFGDNVFELDRGHNFKILDFNNQVQAEVRNGLIYETGKKKNAYFGRNTLFNKSELVIYLSQNWTPKEHTIPLKEFLRVLGKQEEIPGILNYLSHKEIPELNLNLKNLKHINSKIRFNPKAKEETITINKTSSCVLIREIREKLEREENTDNLYIGPFSKARERLKDCANVAAIQYASHICQSEYEQSNSNREYRYAKLSKFKSDESTCKNNSSGQLYCETSWQAQCSYWYDN